MPFQSEKQRRYLHANHPEIAKRWEKEYSNGGITLPKGPAGITSLNGWGSKDESQNKAGADISASMDKNPNDPGWGGGDGPKGPPRVINPPKGPTKAEIEAAKQKELLEQQQRRAQQYSDFYGKFKGDTKKKTDYLSRLLKNDPLYETYKDKGLLDWNNIKSFDQDKRKTAEEIEKMKSSVWGYTRPWTPDKSLYIADIDKFDPTWTPGWTGDSDQEKLNERIAETIGHEARHQVLGNVENRGGPWGWEGQTMWTGDPYSQEVEGKLTMDENSPYSKYMDEGGLDYEGYSTPMTSHELLTRMGDYQSYNDPRVYKDIYGKIHGWMPEHLTSDVANKFYDAAEQFTKDTKARTVGEKYENIDPVMVEGLKRAYPDENIDEALREMSTRDVMDLLQENYQYDEDKKEAMEDDTEAMSALTTPIEGLGGFNYVDTKTLLDAGYDPFEVSTWKNNEGIKLLKSLKNFKKGGVARKKYSTGGVLDITGEEEITTEEGNDISLVDESETGVSTLFRAKNGGYAVQGGVKNYLGEQKMVHAPKYWQSAPDHPETELTYITKPEKDLLVKADLHGSLHGSVNKGPQGLTSLNGWGDAEHGFSSAGETSSDSGWSDNRPTMADVAGPTTGGDQEDDNAQMMRDMFKTNVTNVSGGDIWDWDDTSEVDDVYETFQNVKDRYDKNKTTQGWKVVFNMLTGSLGGVISTGYGMHKDKKAYEEMLNKLKQDAIDLGIPEYNPHTDTLVQTIDQELIDINKKRDEDEEKGGDGPTAPVVAPVTEEIEDSYAMAGNWLQGYRDLKAKQALSAQLQQKWADEREWQQNTMFANSGGLANLFRVKNY